SARDRDENKRNRNGRPRARPSESSNGMAAFEDQVDQRGLEYGGIFEFQTRGGRSRECENAGADYDADSNRHQAPQAERLAKRARGILARRNQFVDRLGA